MIGLSSTVIMRVCRSVGGCSDSWGVVSVGGFVDTFAMSVGMLEEVFSAGFGAVFKGPLRVLEGVTPGNGNSLIKGDSDG